MGDMFRGMKVLVGVLAVAFLLLAAGLWLYGYSPANMSRVRAQVCQHRLRRLFRALEQYGTNFAGEYPLNLSGLQPYVTDLVECPDFPTDGAGLKSYVYVRPGGRGHHPSLSFTAGLPITSKASSSLGDTLGMSSTPTAP